ncbi:MAG: hypothetical protein IT181_17020, partial [Acidobacteria bacterium]|nr:hypothetical protein [Acidobacteriota bacterium]
MTTRRRRPAASVTVRQRNFRWLLMSAIAIATLATAATRAQVGAPVPGRDEAHPNFDIRAYKDYPRPAEVAAAGDYLAKFTAPQRGARLTAARLGAAARLSAAVPGVRIEGHPTLQTTEVVSAAPGGVFLSRPAADRVAALRQFLGDYADVYGVSAADAAGLTVVSDYTNPAGNMAFVELEQRVNGIPVFQGRLRGGFTAKGALVATTGNLAAGVVPEELSATAAVGAEQAVARAAALVGWQVPELALTRKSDVAGTVTLTGPGLGADATAWLVYFQVAPGALRLAWATQIMGDPDAFLTVLDADDGTMLFRKN